MKDKICSVLRFLIRFFRLALLVISGKKLSGGKRKDCSCKEQTKENINETETD